MRYITVDSMEFTYPDMFSYKTMSDVIKGEAPRGGMITFQVLLNGLKADHVKARWLPDAIYEDEKVKAAADIGFPRASNIKIECDCPYEIEWYTLVPATLEQDTTKMENYPNRINPHRVYDCIRPFDGTIDVGVGDGSEEDTGIAGIFGAVKVPKSAEPGLIKANVTVSAGEESVIIPMELNVHKALQPEEETLKIIQNYTLEKVYMYHDVTADSAEFKRIDRNYLKALRRMHQNMCFMKGAKVTKVGENKWDFDFSAVKELMQHWFDAGMKYFTFSAIGYRKSWSAPTIYVGPGIPSMTYEGYCYLSQYLPKLHDFLEENGWLDCVAMEVADEPNDVNATEFRALCGLVRKIVPDIKLLDALGYCDVHGALDVWVFQNGEYDCHREQVETLRANGDEIWHYVCCCPRNNGYVNRFMDYPLLATRYLFWGNYKYDMGGYLHWATNYYQPGQDPYRLNFPMHRNADGYCMLPPGDTHLLYPGEDDVWLSVRGEAQRESAEDFEMLKIVEAKDKAKADEICDKVFKSFKDVEYDIARFRAVRHELLDALAEVQN